jgi:hypothetical protein
VAVRRLVQRRHARKLHGRRRTSGVRTKILKMYRDLKIP